MELTQLVFDLLVRFYVEDSLHRSFFAAGTNQLGVAPLTQYQPQGINDDGLARPGLSGQHIKSQVEVNLQLVNYGYVFYL